MTENPYQPPALSSEVKEATLQTEPQTKRPVSVTAFCCFYACVALLTAYTLYFELAYTFWGDIGRPGHFSSRALFLGANLGYMLVGIVGLWRGRPWGLYVMSFYLLSRILQYAWSVVIALAFLQDILNARSGGFSLLVTAVMAVYLAALLGNLLTPTVLSYTKVPLKGRRRMVFVCLALAAVWVALDNAIHF